MKVFLDTSSLVKLYHEENDTPSIEAVFLQHQVKIIFLSELSKIEFTSTILKKVRTHQLTEKAARDIIKVFESDIVKFTFVRIDSTIIEQAISLITKYGIQGLRTLDSLQFSTAVSLKNYADLFITSDKLLDSFFGQESLPTFKPHNNI